ncbi:MAG: NAD(+)/NADH kinase [Clostridia bacterium]|nr:NAD(+)/NADH kinase [Clostridia bacterium]
MKAGIYYNKNYLTENKPYSEKITKSLEKHGATCVCVNDYCDLDGLDILFVLGGDGTILNVASECARRGVKIIGVNYGHLGFLAEFEREKLDDAIELVCSGNYKTEKRSLLEVEYNGKSYLALNDLVVQRNTGGNSFSNTVRFQAKIDGSIVDNFAADGIIVSTPTGSTAYSLSAGGSVLTPDLNAFIMTPICAHSLHSRPVVYNDNSLLEILTADDSTPLNIVIDGIVVCGTGKNTFVKVKKSPIFIEFITGSGSDFFNKLFIKLNIWSK